MSLSLAMLRNIGRMLTFAVCLLFSLPMCAQSPSENEFPQSSRAIVDLVAAGNNEIKDRITGKNESSPASFGGGAFSYFESNFMAFTPVNGWLSKGIRLPAPPRWRESGFTVAAQLALTGQPSVGTAFLLRGYTDGSDTSFVLFAVMRDSNGRWWVGKLRDVSSETSRDKFTWYAQKVWDPVSPCAKYSCTSDTLYVSFYTNGQIQLNEIVKYVRAGDSQPIHAIGWESGLLNFGLPQYVYNEGPDGARNPVALPKFWDIGYIAFEGIHSSLFSSPAILGEKEYPALHLARLAVFANSTGLKGYGTLSTEAILGDQNSPKIDLWTQAETWINCSSGSFEAPAGIPPTSSRQYDPSQLSTPCTVPSASTNIAVAISGTAAMRDAVIAWEPPAFVGTAFPGQGASITSYVATLQQGGAVLQSCTANGPPTCTIKNSVYTDRPFDVTVTAYRNNNTTEAKTLFPGPTARVEFPASPVISYATEEQYADAEQAGAVARASIPLVVPHLFPESAFIAMRERAHKFSLVLAHLGGHNEPNCAESSACAIKAAYDAGADGIEFNVRLTYDGVPVLGRNDAVARELEDWIWENQVVHRTDAWTPFKNFPLQDENYLNLDRYPFATAFDNKTALNDYRIDLHNPTRSSLPANSIKNSLLVDSYNGETPYKQLTLYEALYLMRKYYGMMVWIKVDNVNELLAVGKVITDARSRLGRQDALASIGLKLNWSTLMHPLVNGDPGKAINEKSIYYMLQLGTGDFDAIARYGGKSPASEGEARINIIERLTGTSSANVGCRSDRYCLGVEIAHKYSGAPTDWFMKAFPNPTNAPNMQLAVQQPVGQYAWSWSMLNLNKFKADTYGRYYPRPDGSCCASLNDELQSSYYFGRESHDNRNLLTWADQIDLFTSVTTDTPLAMLRALYQAGHRSTKDAEEIGGKDTRIPSGGIAPLDVPEGLYYIQAQEPGNILELHAVGLRGQAKTVVAKAHEASTKSMWYVAEKTNGDYTITNAATSTSLNWERVDANTPVILREMDSSPGFLWNIHVPDKTNGSTIQMANGKGFLAATLKENQDNEVFTEARNGLAWHFVPVYSDNAGQDRTQHLPPPGLTFCGVQTERCDIPPMASVAYGANGHFLFTFQENASLLPCEENLVANIDPSYEKINNCFFAPLIPKIDLPKSFQRVADNGGTFTTNGNAVAYGSGRGNTYGLFTYKTFTAGKTVTCENSSFDVNPDPGPHSINHCYMLNSDTPRIGPSGYTFCADSASNTGATDVGTDCLFAGVAAIAYGSDGKFTYKTLMNGAHCDANSFGIDPNPDATKYCFYMPTTPRGNVLSAYGPVDSFNRCADDKCSVAPLGSLMAFGGDNSRGGYRAFATKTTDFFCNSKFFGFSTGGSPTCTWSPQSWAGRAPAGFTFCALEGGVCQYSGAAQIAFGADDKFVYLPHEYTQTVCTVDHFGKDPYPEMKQKACFYRFE